MLPNVLLVLATVAVVEGGAYLENAILELKMVNLHSYAGVWK